ncbi:hypothetical protein GYA27_01340 [candidate division WWE3 bacterium]|uniref:Uncharacterized protein n=1 Tax=candidate division WWE3 bacterium TaxID=2053526 RepID=A0A7X9HGR3_UNCKA|nr:hypothetical protein [candidate division WWE3 bacterium]
MVTDKNKCEKIIHDMKDGDYYGVKFIKKHKLTPNEFRVIEDMVAELLSKGFSGCFQYRIAKIFKKYGFAVSPDEHNVMFYVC